jgi:hypothetical protein
MPESTMPLAEARGSGHSGSLSLSSASFLRESPLGGSTRVSTSEWTLDDVSVDPPPESYCLGIVTAACLNVCDLHHKTEGRSPTPLAVDTDSFTHGGGNARDLQKLRSDEQIEAEAKQLGLPTLLFCKSYRRTGRIYSIECRINVGLQDGEPVPFRKASFLN